MSKLYMSAASDMSRREVTIRGKDYIKTHIRGWEDGIEIVLSDVGYGLEVDVYRTGGSNNPEVRRLIASYPLAK